MRALGLTLLLLGLAAGTAPAQTRRPLTGRRVADFIPPHYEALARGRATGDLNRDGRPDVALVLSPRLESKADSTDEEMQNRTLLLLLGRPGGGYVLAARSSRALLCRVCGGMGTDPFVSLTIRKGVLRLEHYSASGWYRRTVAQFRYQQRTFYLIGETRDYGRTGGNCDLLTGPPGWDFREANFVTGTYEVWKISEACKLLAHKRGQHKPGPLRKLAEYVVAR